jgi:hypothetical protein
MNGMRKLEDIVQSNGACEEINCAESDCPLVDICLLGSLHRGKWISDECRLQLALDIITDEVFFNDTDDKRD